MTTVTKGNVFKDLGFSVEEAERMALQVFLGEQIRTFILRNDLTQARAAAFFGVQQPKISKIMNENLDGMSIDYLVRLVTLVRLVNLVRLVTQTGGKLQYSFRQPRKLSKEALAKRAGAT